MTKIRHLGIAPTDMRHLTPGQAVTLHVHDGRQLIYASSGVLEVTAADGTWFTPSVRAIWVPGGVEHHWQVHGATTVHLVGVPEDMPSPAELRPTLVDATPLFRELMIACSRSGPPASPEAHRLLRVLVDQVQPVIGVATVIPILHDSRLVHIQEIVEAEMMASSSLSALGRRVGASERTLSRLFRDEAGMGFTTWRNQLRLRRSTLLLAEGKTVSYTSSVCGYSSASAFIAVFRKAFGVSPGALYKK
ncbi:MAG: AraC family transcriptional regulator [Acidipropionibacterium sp.]|jgi:AraC-like DNA-binding protein|nr:AraC family transcriptional regulator [Acidipropionibacterium sp.]